MHTLLAVLALLSDERTALVVPVVMALVVALLRVAYAVVSRVVAPYPRVRAIVEAVAALGPDLLRSSQQLITAARGRPIPTLDHRSPDDDPVALRAERDRLRADVARLEAASAREIGDDPGARVTQVHMEAP